MPRVDVGSVSVSIIPTCCSVDSKSVGLLEVDVGADEVTAVTGLVLGDVVGAGAGVGTRVVGLEVVGESLGDMVGRSVLGDGEGDMVVGSNVVGRTAANGCAVGISVGAAVVG